MFAQFCPAAEASVATERLDPPHLRAMFFGVQVLIADDSVLLRKVVAAQLARTGRFDLVVEARDGNEAIGLAELMQPDIVLLDLSMPGLSGLEALPLVLAVAPHARVIVMSGTPGDEMAVRALAAGAVGYLEKGPSLDLVAAIDAVLGAA